MTREIICSANCWLAALSVGSLITTWIAPNFKNTVLLKFDTPLLLCQKNRPGERLINVLCKKEAGLFLIMFDIKIVVGILPEILANIIHHDNFVARPNIINKLIGDL